MRVKHIITGSDRKSVIDNPASARQRDLEDDLGITILDRTNKGVVFTKEGSELLFYAKMLIEQAESIVYHFKLKRYFISKSLVFTPLLLMKQHVFLRKEHPLAHLKSIAAEQLRDFHYLTYHHDDIPLYFAEEFIDVSSIATQP